MGTPPVGRFRQRQMAAPVTATVQLATQQAQVGQLVGRDKNRNYTLTDQQ